MLLDPRNNKLNVEATLGLNKGLIQYIKDLLIEELQE